MQKGVLMEVIGISKHYRFVNDSEITKLREIKTGIKDR